jgi:hypothetical protein
MLRHIMCPLPLTLSYEMEECPGGEDMGRRSLQEPIPRHPILEPRRWGIRVPIPLPLMWSFFHLLEKEFQCLQYLFIFGHHYPNAL